MDITVQDLQNRKQRAEQQRAQLLIQLGSMDGAIGLCNELLDVLAAVTDEA
jgi:hypothetical protein